MISLADYYMGRADQYGDELTDDTRLNAEETVKRVNELLALLLAHDVPLSRNPHTGSLLSSGWRPRTVNAAIHGAAVNSKHMTGQACDLYDPDGDIDEWCMENQDKLDDCGLWLEHPSATKGWCHVQVVPPRSGRRVFFP